MEFVNRTAELAALEAWWSEPGGLLGLLWGRRRVGKTVLLEHFAAGRRTVFHTAAGRPQADELRLLASATASLAGAGGIRNLVERPFVDWQDALESLAELARDEPLLVVLDEFPELVGVNPELPGVLRAFWDRARSRTQLRILICGSAVRTMQQLQEERAPLYGRFDLARLVHPFEPHEAALMLPRLAPAERALVWGITGGMPLYLSWWDQERSVGWNLRRLVTEPGGRLLTEGQLVLATETSAGQLETQVLRAIAAGRTKHNEIADAVRADPTRSLERLAELRLIERLAPVTEDIRRTRRRIYRVADNFLSFWLTIVEPHRAEIERGLGEQISTVIERSLDDHMGPKWEEAVRGHVRRLAAAGRLGEEIVAVGSWWRDAPPVEIDVVALAGRARQPVLVGEVKWGRSVDGRALLAGLRRSAGALPGGAPPDLAFLIAAREEVRDADGALVVTTDDVFVPGDLS